MDENPSQPSVLLIVALVGLQVLLPVVPAVLGEFSIFPQTEEKDGTGSSTRNPKYDEIDQPFYNGTAGVPTSSGTKPPKPMHVTSINAIAIVCLCAFIGLRIFNIAKKPVTNSLRERVAPFLPTAQVLLFAIINIFLFCTGFQYGGIDLESNARHWSFNCSIIGIAFEFFLLICLDFLLSENQIDIWKDVAFWACYCLLDTMSVFLHLDILSNESWGNVRTCASGSSFKFFILSLPSLFAIFPACLFLALSYSARDKSDFASFTYFVYLVASLLLNVSSIILRSILMGVCGAGMSYELVKNCVFTFGLLTYLIAQLKISSTCQSGIYRTGNNSRSHNEVVLAMQ